MSEFIRFNSSGTTQDGKLIPIIIKPHDNFDATKQASFYKQGFGTHQDCFGTIKILEMEATDKAKSIYRLFCTRCAINRSVLRDRDTTIRDILSWIDVEDNILTLESLFRSNTLKRAK